jgi:hypothetical protein
MGSLRSGFEWIWECVGFLSQFLSLGVPVAF